MKTINYKNHTIILDGIVATLHCQGQLIYKTRFMAADDVVKQLKNFINQRLEQIERDKHVNIYA